jgi:hypothetical protein
MTVETLLLVATTLIALVAAIAAIVAIRAVRRLEHQARPSVVEAAAGIAALEATAADSFEGRHATTSTTEVVTSTIEDRPMELAPRVVQGRVIVPPTQAQVVRTALGRPGVRLNIFVHGLARALRAENRDRIVSLMRREYRHRRRERLRAGRQAVRLARPTSAPSTERLHAEFAEPRPLSLTERMIGS